MYKLSLKLLLSRIKWFILMCASISLPLIMIISINTSSESIKMGIIENGYQEYGEHSLVLLNSQESLDSLQKNRKIEKLGRFQLLGTIDLQNDHEATVGIMDDDAQKIGRIEIIEGTFPIDENGVAIESTYLSLIDENWKIGEEKALEINGKSINVLLTGIIKDYSAKWTVPVNLDKGRNDFPNIVISENNSLTKSAGANYLIKLKGNVKKQEQEAYSFLSDSSNEYINDRLFSLGLQNYENITIISSIFKTVILLTSFLCIYSISYFFYTGQQRKLSLLRAVGARKNDFLKITFLQNSVIFSCGFIIALPFILLLHKIIINNTFNVSNYALDSLIQTTISAIIWLLIILIITYWNTIRVVRRVINSSINESLNGIQVYPYAKKEFADNKSNFHIKQIARQILTYPKQSILMILTITFSLLIIIFSIYVEKETAELWHDDRYQYYLNAQEIYEFNTVDNLTVLSKPGLTFSNSDVTEIEKSPGISYIQKTPFLVDLHPLIKKENASLTLNYWINQHNDVQSVSDEDYNGDYDGKQIIPNVQYMLLNEEEFLKLYPERDYKEFKDKVIMYIPSNIDDSNNKLINSSISFVRKELTENDGYDTNRWEYNILDVFNEPFTINLDDNYQITMDNLLILLDEQTAIDNGIFRGYNELDIYVDKELTTNQRERIESNINKIIALTPGSLYQNIPMDFSDRSNISFFIGLLGKLAFTTSIILSALSITVIAFSKYMLRKKEWGIYLAMGMKKRNIYFLLYYEMILYFATATILALSIFSYTLLFVQTEYSLIYYLRYFTLSAFIIFLLISIGMIFTGIVIKNQSIFSLLRENE